MYFFMSVGAEYFKGAPGGRGRPGNAGYKGVKGAVVILSMIKKIVDRKIQISEVLTHLLSLP